MSVDLKATIRIAIVLLSMIACEGCVERKEHLSISPTGGVMYKIMYASESPTDLYEGDAVPLIAGGWVAEQIVEKNEEGKETFRLRAQRFFAPGAELPWSFALAHDADAEAYLQFPTSVTIEERADGTYYHFSRRYGGREWAAIEVLRQQHLEVPLQELKGVEPSDWTPVQRIAALRALASFEIHKMLSFARTAFAETTPKAPQDSWLAVRYEMLDCIDRLDYQSLEKLLEPVEEPREERARKDRIEAETEKFQEMSMQRMKQAVRELAGYNGSQTADFVRRYELYARIFEISEDLGDDSFEITVEMPGEIIASNSDSQSPKTANWRFSGEMLRDRELELMATSRVAR